MSIQSKPHPSRLYQDLIDAVDLVLKRNASGEATLWVLRRHMLAAVLRMHQGNQCQSARWLVKHRNTIARQIKDFQLQDYVRQLVGKSGPQLRLFQSPVRKAPKRESFARNPALLHSNSQGNHRAYSQDMNRFAG
jgi:hypothetical protein